MKNFLLILSLILLFSDISAQKKGGKLQKKSTLKKNIEYSQKLIEKNKSKANISNLRLINSNIGNRRKLIREIKSEISGISKQIEEINTQVKAYEKQINYLKANYAKLIRIAFRKRTIIDKIMFIFSAKTFYQGYNRYQYLVQLGKKRKGTIKNILKKKDELITAIQKLMQENNTKKILLLQTSNEHTKLTKVNKLRDSTLAILKKNNDTETQAYKESRTSLQLDSSVAVLVTKDVGLLVEQGKKDASRKFSSNKNLADDDGFASRKGDLLMPVEEGIIINTFGIHEHPVLENIKLRNDGVDIRTNDNSSVKAVAKGKVINVIEVPYKNLAVLIKHGEYYTLYSNLVNVKVVVGEIVTEESILGNVFYDQQLHESVLQFQIWYKNTPVNPQLWLRN